MLHALMVFAVPYLKEIVVCCGCYVIFSILGLLLSHVTQIEAWVARYPKLALLFLLFRRAGFDVWGLAKDLRTWAATRANIKAAADGVQKVGVVLVFLALPWTGGCASNQAAKVPTTVQVATAAINLTDEALSLAIEQESPSGTALAVWDKRVLAVETAAAAVRTGQNVCSALPNLLVVAGELKCSRCQKAIEATKEALSCPK